jgi:RimJ/RimL family protein N-acetyltransferase
MTPADIERSTERLHLSALTTDDLEAIWPSVSDPAVSADMSWSPHQSKVETLEFLKQVERNLAEEKSITWTLRAADRFCGIFSLINIQRSHRALRYDRAELAYWCAVAKQGQGLMTEAGLNVIQFGFTSLGLHRLVVWHHLENERSRRLIERLGFKLIGVEHEAFMKNGRWIDTRMYELLRNDPAAPKTSTGTQEK